MPKMDVVDLMSGLSKTKKRKPYTRISSEELKQFREIVMQTHHTLKHTNRLSELNKRSAWVDITSKLHAQGWPKRSWINLRHRGEKFLNRKRNHSNTNGVSPAIASSQQNDPNSVALPSLVLYDSHPLLYSKTLSSALDRLGPPPLIPSTDALETHAPTCPTDSPRLHNVPSTEKSKKIIESRKELYIDLSELPRKTPPPPTNPAPLTKNGPEQAPRDQIDLSAHSDTDGTVESGIHSACSSLVPTIDNSAAEETIQENTCTDDRQTPAIDQQIDKKEFIMRMRMYEKKLEALEWKKAFWAMKYRSLNQNCAR